MLGKPRITDTKKYLQMRDDYERMTTDGGTEEERKHRFLVQKFDSNKRNIQDIFTQIHSICLNTLLSNGDINLYSNEDIAKLIGIVFSVMGVTYTLYSSINNNKYKYELKRYNDYDDDDSSEGDSDY
jgi:hypothetical protein